MAVGTSAATVCERFQDVADRHADALALTAPDGTRWTWEEYADRVRTGAAGLAGLGLGRGDVVACWLSNRPEFHVADAAAMHLGATSFSVYNTSTVDQARHVVRDAGARVIITEPAHVDAAIAVRDSSANAVEHIVCVEGDQPEGLGWDELLEAADPRFDFEATWQTVEAGDLATLIYTSGTTGPPKGVELTHANISTQTQALAARLRFPQRTRAVSFLPMAHIAERLCTHYFPMFGAWQVTCCPDLRELPATLRDVRPGYFFSPPRIWEKLRAALLARATDAERADLDEAISRVLAGDGPQDGEVQRAARERVGFGELRVAIVGAAPCPVEVLSFWHACGVPLCELYGMSETTGVATVAAPDEVRVGTVGTALDVCEVRLSDSGEILMRGPVLMRGYRNQPGQTAEAVDADGWLHSGDVGELDADGHLRVVDRIKELIVSSTGKNMSPANIESTLKGSATLMGQACAVGDGRPYNVALLTLEPEAAAAFAAREAITSRQLADHRRVLEAVRAEVAMANAKLAPIEQIKRFLLLDEEWLPDGDELTPTMKLKRKPIAEKYEKQINALYDGSMGINA